MLPEIILLFLAFSANAEADDRDLADRIRKGDHEAFKKFFERHSGMLAGFLHRRGVDGDTSADLIQNAFLTIWEKRTSIDPGKSLRAYLFKISLNRAYNHFRDTAKFQDTENEDTAGTQPDPHQSAENTDMMSSLHRIVITLPEKRREVFELCYLQGLTYREAAETLDVSTKTIENHMTLALKTIRAGMKSFL